jgi:hypothetical protein
MSLPVSTHAHHLFRHHQSLALINHSSLRLRRSRACGPTLIGARPVFWPRLSGAYGARVPSGRSAPCSTPLEIRKRRNRLTAWIGNWDCMRVLCYIDLLGFSQFCSLIIHFVELFLCFIVFVCLSLTSCLSCAFSLLPP